MSNPPPTKLLPVLERLKCAYLLWYGYYQKLPRIHRYTLGERIDFLFIELMEAIACASFSARHEKMPFLRVAIRKLDALKILLLVLWETKSLDTNKYGALSIPLEEVGRMLGGWLRGIETKTPAGK
ncbi:MAG TPA: four helix bundle protein [Candidatus Paceibacterota bacterium]|nr:four helix bundle protein [Candidatus Paceibacterota bacterium]